MIKNFKNQLYALFLIPLIFAIMIGLLVVFKDKIPQEKIYNIIPEICFVDGSLIFSVGCIKLLISRILGYICVVLGFTFKVPQITKIYFAKSVEGISYSSLMIDMTSLSFGNFYNYYRNHSISIYGDIVIAVIADILMTYFHFIYSKENHLRKAILFIIYLIICSLFILKIVPASIFDFSLLINQLTNVAYKVIQFRLNYKNKSTGQLSAAMILISVSISFTRIFNILIEIPDNYNFMVLFLISISGNAALLLQIWYYGKYYPKQKIY